jgi:transposase
MLDWVPEGHAVLVVIGTVEAIMTPGLLARLVPPTAEGTARGPARYDPVMLLTVWLYAYLRGVLSTRAVEDRCRYDATFRVACGRQVPDHPAFSRFRQCLFGRDGLAEDLFCRVLSVCACAGLGRLSVVAADGVKIAANAPEEANRTEAGLRKLAGTVMRDARQAAAADEALQAPLPGRRHRRPAGAARRRRPAGRGQRRQGSAAGQGGHRRRQRGPGACLVLPLARPDRRDAGATRGERPAGRGLPRPGRQGAQCLDP